MPSGGISEVAREKIWAEHCRKCTNAHYRQFVASKPPVFTINPYRMVHDKPISEPINRRAQRFLNRELVALEAITKRIGLIIHPPAPPPQPLPTTTNADAATSANSNGVGGELPKGSFLPPIKTLSTRLNGENTQGGGGKQQQQMMNGRVGGSNHAKEDDDFVVSLLGRVHRVPSQKYHSPQTEMQEIGWIQGPMVPADPRFRFGMKNCEITKYAMHLPHGKGR